MSGRLPRLVAAALLFVAAGCSTSTSPTTTNGLTIMLKDSPFSDARALFVTFSIVSVHASGGSFVTVPFAGGASSRTCDLKRLTSAQDVLGTGVLTPGHYTQIRLVVASSTIYFDTPASGATPCAPTLDAPPGRSAPVVIPSGEIILNREFDLSSTTATTITLDFDGDQSVKQTGNGTYMMTPVIAIESVQ
jgi:hypothetical protein